MDAAQALADLTQVSSQIEGAVLADESGDVLASTFGDAVRADAVAGAALALLGAAEESVAQGGRAALTHVVAETASGAVFVVRDGDRVVAATTGPEPTTGLVVYDLKTCLRMTAEQREEPKGKLRTGTSGGRTRTAASSVRDAEQDDG